MKLSVVIPALNEEEGIGRTIDDLNKTLKGLEYEIIVIDDGSTDNTSKIVNEKKAVLVRHKVNKGYGAAIKTGIKKSKFDTICLLDADHTYPPDEIPHLMSHYTELGGIISGSRFLGTNTGMPIIRKLGNMFFIRLTSLLLLKRVHDVSSGMKIFSKDTIEKLKPLPDTLDMMLVITIRAIKKGISFKEIPITYMDRKGASKLSAFKEGARFFKTIVKTALLG